MPRQTSAPDSGSLCIAITLLRLIEFIRPAAVCLHYHAPTSSSGIKRCRDTPDSIGLPDLLYFTGDPVFQTLSPASLGELPGRTNLL